MAPPAKRAKLLSDDEGSDSGGDDRRSAVSGVPNGFKINEEFARRFEHNEKRKEQHQLEEKYGKSQLKRSRDDLEDEDEDESSSSDESEDDNAELATEDVDVEIMDTLNAIRKKDPRVYDKDIHFYKEYNPDAGEAKAKVEKPMYLQDYHRQNLLAGHTGAEDDAMEMNSVPTTYAQEQQKMKEDLVGSMHATANGHASDDDDEADDDLLVTKSKPTHTALPTASSDKPRQITDADVAAANKDPETYLSNFMASRAWLPTSTSKWQAFDSDDSDEDERAEKFESAYNLRFEDPARANEELRTFARDTGKYSVRRDETKSARQRTRDREKEKKEAEKREREEEKARLRKLRIEEAEGKVRRIKEAAGMGKGDEIDFEEWKGVIDGDFDEEGWEREMEKRFGEGYYASRDEGMGEDGEEGEEDGEAGKKRKKLHKPRWEDDIDINDLVPEFEDDKSKKPEFTLTDDEDDAEENGIPSAISPEEEASPEPTTTHKRKTKKDVARAKSDAKRTARRERAAIESLVDANLPLTTDPSSSTSAKNAPSGFRYRATSPTTFGLSNRDILFADDKQLNEFAGLKKLTAWREEEKKRRDRKRFSKKGRLREWRRGVFGGDGREAPQVEVEEGAAGATGNEAGEKRKKKRSRKGKGKGEGGGLGFEGGT